MTGLADAAATAASTLAADVAGAAPPLGSSAFDLSGLWNADLNAAGQILDLFTSSSPVDRLATLPMFLSGAVTNVMDLFKDLGSLSLRAAFSDVVVIPLAAVIISALIAVGVGAVLADMVLPGEYLFNFG